MLTTLPPIFGFFVYFAINLFLWALPISHQLLFFVTAPLGILYFAVFMWYVMRTRPTDDM
jgi:hypothetical protein